MPFIEFLRRSPARWPVALLSFSVFFAAGPRVAANDAAVETAAGGLVLKSERRVVIMKERLQIGKQTTPQPGPGRDFAAERYPVVVEYEFRNESESDVTSEVAFPLPEYGYPWEDLIQDRRIRGFRLFVDGKSAPFETEIRAKAGDRDVTDLLMAAGVDLGTFGKFQHHLESGDDPYEVRQLPEETRRHLKDAGAIDENLDPRWKIAITYHWTQRFPVGQIVRIRHEYDAIAGFSYDYEPKRYLSSLPGGCFETGLVASLNKAQRKLPRGEFPARIDASWVRYILTTANTWKTPIRDFELVVERPAGEFVSFCWDGKVERSGATRFEARVRDFRPTSELLIYFLAVAP